MSWSQWTIECRIFLTDKKSKEIMGLRMRHLAQKLLTEAELISEGGNKPTIAMFSEDFFVGKEDIELFTKEELDKGIAEVLFSEDNPGDSK